MATRSAKKMNKGIMAPETNKLALAAALAALVTLSCQAGICNECMADKKIDLAQTPPFTQTETQETPERVSPEASPGQSYPSENQPPLQRSPSQSNSQTKLDALERALHMPIINRNEGLEDAPEDPAFEQKIHDLNCKILLKELEFAKFNIHFRQQANVQGRWRGLRYFVSQETASTMIASGLLGKVIARERSLVNTTRTFNRTTGQVVAKPRPLNRHAIERALCSQMIGQQIGSLGALTELGINYYHSRQAKKNGFDRVTSLKKAIAMRQELKALLSEREQLVESVLMMPTQRAVLRYEGQVLRDICHLTFDEYRRYHVMVARFRAFQNSLFIGDFLKNSVGWPGNLIAILGQAERNPRLSGPSGICVGTSGALIALNPIVSRGVGKFVENRTRRKLQREFGSTESQDLNDFEKDTRLLREALVKHRQYSNIPMRACEDRMALYETEDLSRQKSVELALSEIKAGQRSATQNVATAQVVGLSKIANGIGLMLGGFRYPNNPRAGFPTIVNTQIAYMSGSCFGSLDNIRIQVQAERTRRRLKRQRLLPEQVFGDRLKALEELEKRVNSPL